MIALILITAASSAIGRAQDQMPEPPAMPAFIAPAPKLPPKLLARAEAGLARFRGPQEGSAPAGLPAMPAIPERLAPGARLSEAEQRALDASFTRFLPGGRGLASVGIPEAPVALAPESPVQETESVVQPAPAPALVPLKGSIVGLELEPLPADSLVAAAAAAQQEEPTLFARIKRKLLVFQP